MKGHKNVWISENVHAKLKSQAALEQTPMNQYLDKLLKELLK